MFQTFNCKSVVISLFCFKAYDLIAEVSPAWTFSTKMEGILIILCKILYLWCYPCFVLRMLMNTLLWKVGVNGPMEYVTEDIALVHFRPVMIAQSRSKFGYGSFHANSPKFQKPPQVTSSDFAGKFLKCRSIWLYPPCKRLAFNSS